MYDVTNTIKVSHIRVFRALCKALTDLDAAMPEMLTIAGVADARREEERLETVAKYEKRMKEFKERQAEWNAYEKAKKDYEEAYLRRTWRSPPMGEPPEQPAYSRPDYFMCNAAPRRKAYESETSVYAVKEVRRLLKERVDIAGLAMAPYRVDHTQAAFIASCENGDYVEKVKRQAGFTLPPN